MDDLTAAAPQAGTAGGEQGTTSLGSESSLPDVAQDTAAGLLEVAPDAILQVDRDGTISLANARVEELFGWKRAELVGQSVDVLVPDTFKGVHARHRDGYVAEPRVRPMGAGAPLRGRHRDGTEFPVEISLSPLVANGEMFVVAIVRDVTERSQIEEELRRTRDRLVEAQRLARLGSWEWDIPANRVIWSDELFRIYGHEPGAFEPSYEKFLEHVHPDDRESVDQRNHKAFADHRPFEDVKQCLRADGETFLMRTQGEVITDGDGNPVRMLGVCEDVTAERRAEEDRAMLASLVVSSDDAIVTCTAEGRIMSWNPAAESVYGYTEQDALGADIRMLIPDEAQEEEMQRVAEVAAGGHLDHYETRTVRADGSVIDVSLSMSALRDAEGELIGISTIARDISERKRIDARLHYLANNDPLTRLFNRHRFEEELILQVAKARRYGAAGAVLVLDLDNFKYINDAYGHGAGDEVLQSIAEVLRARLRDSDIVARLGGDEFAVLVPEAGEDQARAIANELLEAVREHAITLDGRPVRVTTSIGGTLIEADSAGAEELLTDADRAMYDAKDSGRDRALVLDGDDRSGERRTGRQSWEHRIREALDDRLFVLHCQPILDLRRNEVSQYELLLRMTDGERLIGPGAFLGEAERLGLIHEIDRWVASQAIELLAAKPDLTLEVNLSGASAGDEQLLRMIRSELEQSNADPSRLIFEITETATIASLDQASRFASALGELGCSFAIDDFGTGFGSFYYLKRIPIEYLKIDGDFVRAPRSRTDELVVESIVRMAQGLGKRTVAEFVEDADALESMRAHGVDFAQGFHIGRPMPVTELD